MKAAKKFSAKRLFIVLLCTLAVLSAGFFTTDLIRAKRYKLPPVFCITVIDYENGSKDHYGLGYKVWEDYDPFDRTTDYYVGFWLIPKFFCI
ncbi:MAG: hypothetical protein ACI4JK_00375 [Oscillospiraceae bacterium]